MRQLILRHGLGLSLIMTLIAPANAAKPKPAAPQKEIPLSDVVRQVEVVLDTYQAIHGKNPDLKLQSADFDFKTVADKTGGFTLNILIFQLGASRDKQATNEMNFTYVPNVILDLDQGTPQPLDDALYKAMDGVATAVVKERNDREVFCKTDPASSACDSAHLVRDKIVITVAFGVTDKFSAGASAPVVGGLLTPRSKLCKQ